MDYKKCIFGAVITIALIFIGSLISVAQNSTDTTDISLKELLQNNRYPLEIENGKLSGEGGDWLRKKAIEATVVTVGETHASKEIPALITALIKEMQQADAFDYMAIEMSPWTTQLLTDHLQKAEGAYNRFIKKYPSAIPFYNFKTERDLLHQVVKESNHKKPLWGLDQIFAFSTDLVFDRLEELAPTDSLRNKIRKIRKAGSQKVADDPRLQKLPKGMPPPISVYEPATFDSLKAAFEGIGEAQKILSELSKSIKIYRLNDQNNYVSNQIRARYLRDNLRESFQKAQQDDSNPQIVIKVGARHAYRGITPNNALDVGNLAISMARSMDGEAFNVAVICGPGSKNMSFPARTTDCWPEYLGSELESLSKNQAVVFNLAGVHPKLHESDMEIPHQLEAFLWGFDAVVIIPNTQPAELIATPGCNNK